MNNAMNYSAQNAELTKDAWTLGVIQSRVVPARDRAGMDSNLEHMLHLIDNAFHYGGGPDLLFFHEFPISGWDTWTREEALERCIELPGPESEKIAEKARKYGCYIAFGAYVRDEDWPGHVLSITSLISPKGEIVAKHWKARNVKGVFPNFELFTTSVYDVLDEYIERYGRDAVLPIARTELGNIALSSTQLEPEIFRGLAIKGAEVILRTATGGFTQVDVQATAMHNRVYCAIVNNSLMPQDSPYFEDHSTGGSAIYGPDGKALAGPADKHETMLTARIPIADFRARHLPPDIHWDLVSDIYETYESRYPANLFSEYQPTDLQDSGRYLADKSRWA